MSNLTLLKLFLTTADVIIVVGFIYSIVQAWQYRPKFSYSNKPAKKVLTLQDSILKERWKEIVGKIKPEHSDSWKLAIIEADKMADDILIRLGLGAGHMADRLGQLNQDDFKSLKKLWDAHRFRNDLVHGSESVFSPEKLRWALGAYEAFFHEVGVL